MAFEDINVGDRITFVAPTRYSGARALTRVVTGTSKDRPWSTTDFVTVRAHGTPNFYVHPSEIQDHQPREVQSSDAGTAEGYARASY